MNMRRGLATAAAAIVAAGALAGCCCKVCIVESRQPSSGSKPWRGDDRDKLVARAGQNDAVEVIRLGRTAPQFMSTVRATDAPIRLIVSGADPAMNGRDGEDVFPAFGVHFHPDDGEMQEVGIEFEDAPKIVYAPAAGMTGWLYFHGHAPIGRTRRVRAVGSGTEFLIEVGPSADYVYMLGGVGDHVDVYALLSDDPTAICVTLTYGQWTSVDNDGVCTAPAGFVGDPSREAFVNSAMAEVEAYAW